MTDPLHKRPLRSSRGQATTEWLMIAGVFAAIGLFVVRIVPGALKTFVAGLSMGIKSVAP